MSTKSKTKKTAKKDSFAHNIVWFEIPADKPERAQKFYGSLFGWNISAFPAMTDYWHIDTKGKNDAPDGGLMVRKHPGQPITNYILVPSVARFMAKVKKFGGEVCLGKTAVPGMGYLAICKDTEANTFALWEANQKAK